MYSTQQIETALALYQQLKSITNVCKCLGYPTFGTLANWIDKYAAQEPDLHLQRKTFKHASWQIRQYAVRQRLIDKRTLYDISQEIGYSQRAIIRWCNRNQQEGSYRPMETSNNKPILSSPEDKNDQSSQLDELKAQVKDLQFEVDLLRETLNVIKKDQGANLKTLKNREKTVIVGALKDVYPLSFICKKLSLSRSCYYYHSSLTKTKDKYQDARKRIADIFHSNYDAYGYRRIYSALKQQKICISEKVIRRIMKRDGLVVTVKRRRKYNSYKGEITPAVPNLVNRDFHADKPNQLWLTDITEFSIKAGKVYLSALIDCFDGMPVWDSYTISEFIEEVNKYIEWYRMKRIKLSLG